MKFRGKSHSTKYKNTNLSKYIKCGGVYIYISHVCVKYIYFLSVYVYIHIDEEMKFKISEADEMDEFLRPWKP